MNQQTSHEQFNTKSTNTKLNLIRAAVLGANDGIVSVAGVVVGVAGATSNQSVIFTAGMAAIIAGALSMAAGEYVSVSSQRDTEKALIEEEKVSLEENPEREKRELAEIYMSKGLSESTALKVAEELTEHDPIKAHLEAEIGIKEDELTSPTQAAIASAVSFVLGASIPITAILVPAENQRISATFISVIFALAITGYLSAHLGGAPKLKAIIRVVIGGFIAMAVTYGVGSMLGVHI